jgi:hypothetical protein
MREKMRKITVWPAFVALTLSLVVSGSAQAGEGKWLGPDNQLLPFQTDEEVLDFLRTAKVIKFKELTSGKNRPLKVRLEKDGIQANAIFRMVDKRRDSTVIYGKRFNDFHDSYLYECAAYKVSRLLGLDTVPPCVNRRFDKKNGSMQLWVENAQTIQGRVEDNNLPDNRSWSRQRQIMQVFDSLIYNFDRNQGNMLLDANDKLWFIDHTRSFPRSSKAPDLDKIVWCERHMWEALKSVDKDSLVDLLTPEVEYRRVISMVKRQQKIVEHIQGLIDSRGAEAVLFDDEPATEVAGVLR